MSLPRVLVVTRLGGRVAEFIGPTVSEVSWDLYDSDTASISIDPIANAGKTFTPGVHELQVWDDDDLVWWGVPWRLSGNFKQITFECEGLDSYFRKRFVDRMTLLYTSLEQRTIAWNLVEYAQEQSVQANRDLNIDSAVFAGTTHIRSREHKREDHAMILDLLREFPKLNDGFDWKIIYNATGQRLWTPFYPQRGSLKANHRLQWKMDGTRRDLLEASFDIDWAGIATQVYATGGSNGGVKFEENYEDTAASAIYGVMQAFIADGSQLDVAWLEDKATREVNLRKIPIIVPEITVPRYIVDLAGNTIRDYLMEVSEGDSLPVEIDAGIVSFTVTQRIKTKVWSPADDRITFTFNEAAA